MCQICFKHKSWRNTVAAIYSLSLTHNIVLLVEPTCDQEFNIFWPYLPIHRIPHAHICYKAAELDTTNWINIEYCQWSWNKIIWKYPALRKTICELNMFHIHSLPSIVSCSIINFMWAFKINFSSSFFNFYLTMYNIRWCTPNWFN